VIASLRGLVVLVAIAIALCVVFMVSAPQRRLDTGFLWLDSWGEPSSLAWTESGKEQVIVRRADARGAEISTWMVSAEPRPVPADPATIDAVLSALRAAKWHRSADATVAGPMQRELHVGDNYSLGLGGELPGAAQTWLISGKRALLFDSWVVRALFPEPLALRVRHPLAAAAAADVIEGPNSVRLHGRFQDRPVIRWLAEAPFTELTDAIAAIEIVALDSSAKLVDSTRAISLSPGGAYVQEAGICEGNRVRVQTSVGNGCVERAVWDRALAACAALEREEPTFVDRRPVPFTPTQIDFANGKHLVLGQSPKLDSEPANPAGVAALLAALGEPAEVVPRPTGKPRASLTVWAKGIKLELDVFGAVIARHDESFALRPLPSVIATVGDLAALENPLRWHEDAHTLTAIKIDGITYKSGDVIGEWTREPAGAIDNAIVSAAAEALATVRAPKGPLKPKMMFHHLTLTFTPPVGSPMTHQLEVGQPHPDGCPATVDGAPIRMPAEMCTAIAALAALKK